MDSDTTEEDINLPSSTGSSLTGIMGGLGNDEVLVVPGEMEKLVHPSNGLNRPSGASLTI